jgi:sporulation protein YlmC with PRC-barrel domain
MEIAMPWAATPSPLLSSLAAMAPISIIGAEELLASEVVDCDGSRIGGLRDLMVDLRLGRIAYGLVALDRAPRLNRRLVAVPWNAMHVDCDRKLRVTAHRYWVERGPSIPQGLKASLLDHEWAEFVHSYFGARPYWERNAQHA